MRWRTSAIGLSLTAALIGLIGIAAMRGAGGSSKVQGPSESEPSASERGPDDVLRGEAERIVVEESERCAPEPRGGHDLAVFLMRAAERKVFPDESPPRLLPRLDAADEERLISECIEEWERATSKRLTDAVQPFAIIAQKLELDLDPGVGDYEPSVLREFGDYAAIEARRLRALRDSRIRSRLRALDQPRALSEAEIEAIFKRLGS